tara:strand:- start:198 stop:1355 length:1158 start_codon:yes stop_codon:yes gene_type:complete
MSEIKVNSIKGVAASTAALSIDNTDGTCTANITNNLSNRNAIVNGGCLVAQRGTSSASADFASVDRMKLSVTNMDQLAWLQKQSDDAPDGFQKSWEFDVTTAENALDADDLVYMRYAVEAQDLTPFFNANGTGKDFILSFYVKAYQTGTYQISIFQLSNSSRFITKTYTIAQSGVWQRIELAFTGDTNQSGFSADNALGFQIAFQLIAGSNYTSGGQVTNWGGFGNSHFAAGQAVNVGSSTDNYWKITGIQLELDQGSGKATDFEHRSFAQELALCQRYFARIPNQDASSGYAFLAQAAAHDTNSCLCTIPFPVFMRTNPSMSTPGSLRLYDGGGITISSLILNSATNASGTLQISSSSGIERYRALSLGQNNDPDSAIDFLAEL